MSADPLAQRLLAFMAECVYPSEPEFQADVVAGSATDRPPVMDRLADEARRRGLWNALLPVGPDAHDLGECALAPLLEITGRSPVLAAAALNLSTPDSENMRLLAVHGTDGQRDQWLPPLLAGSMRSAFCVTEPGVAGSDPTRITAQIEVRGRDLVVTGTKDWCTGAAAPDCGLLVVLGVTDPDAPRSRRFGLVLVPAAAPGVRIDGHRSVFGYGEGYRGGRSMIHLDGVRVPRSALLGDPGQGLQLAQSLLVPARLHHCMRLLGVGERALSLLCDRALHREVAGGALADRGVVQGWVADARISLEHIRALVRQAAERTDEGDPEAPALVSIIKASTPRAVERIVDHAIQAFGADGLSHEWPLAMLWTYARTLRLSDGPDEVHRAAVARRELDRARGRPE